MTICREIKQSITGDIKVYSCELIRYEPGFGLLRYVVDREYDIQGYRLQAGDVTRGLYWEGRPYTLYAWDLEQRGGRLFYFNVADRVALAPAEFFWRDLVLDVLVDAKGGVSVLDEHELPEDLDRNVASYISSAVDLITRQYREIIKETDDLIRRYDRQ